MDKTNKEVARIVSEEIWGQGRTDLVDEYYAEDYVDHNPPPGVPGTREGLKQQLQMFRAAFPDMQARIDELIEAGDRVVVRYTVSGTHSGDGMGIPPTGKPVEVAGITMMRLAGGKLVEEFSVTDMLGMYQQLGLVPAARP